LTSDGFGLILPIPGRNENEFHFDPIWPYLSTKEII
jgi:hypothetical protein